MKTGKRIENFDLYNLKRIISLKTLSKFLSYGSAVTVAGLLALALVWTGPISTADAALAGSTPSSAKVVSANGTATVTFTSGTSTASASGDLIQFTASKGTWPNGSNVYTVAAASTGKATAKLKSSTIGNAVVSITNLSDGSNTTITNNNVTFVGTPTWSGKSVKSSLELNTTVAADADFFDTVADNANGARVLSATTPTATDALGNTVFVTITLANDGNADTPGKILLTGTDANGSTQQESVALTSNTTVTSNKAFKSVTSAVVSGFTADGNADNMTIGYAANRVGVVNNPTALAYSSSSTLDVDGLSDSKGNLIAGAVVTMTIDGDGTWDNTGTKEVVVVTDANGDITAQGLTVGSGGKSATITTATSGSFGVSSVTTKLKQNGVYATAELTGNSSTVAIIDKLADNEASTAILRILTKDSGGNKVDSTSTPTVTCAGSTSTGKALIASASVADATASDGYREVSVDPANASATPAVCTWKIAASGTEPASSGTFNVTVADNAIKTVTVSVGDGSDVNPGVPVTVTATLLDKNGVAIRTGQPAETVTLAVNGTSGGNQLINATTRTHKNGVVTATFIPGDKLGNYTITATPSVSTTKVGYAVVKIASATAAEPAVSITGDVSASGSSLVVINGSASGSKIVELTDAKSVWITENGVYKGYVAGAPAFVNADFPVANTGAVIVVK